MNKKFDVYFSADVETDGSIPGPYSMLSFGLVVAGTFDGEKFKRPKDYSQTFYREIKPISDSYEPEALNINGLDRNRLQHTGVNPQNAMNDAYDWVMSNCNGGSPVFVAYPLSFDWIWMFWYFSKFSTKGSPFGHSRCMDIKSLIATRLNIPISEAGRSSLPKELRSSRNHSHNALDDAIEQAEIFAKAFEWKNI